MGKIPDHGAIIICMNCKKPAAEVIRHIERDDQVIVESACRECRNNNLHFYDKEKK